MLLHTLYDPIQLPLFPPFPLSRPSLPPVPPLFLRVGFPRFPYVASVWPSPKQTRAGGQRSALVAMSASQVITSRRSRCSTAVVFSLLSDTLLWHHIQPVHPTKYFLSLCCQSFPRWETDSKITCEQTLPKGEGPKTSWTREITNDGKLILVSHKKDPLNQGLDLEILCCTFSSTVILLDTWWINKTQFYLLKIKITHPIPQLKKCI